MMSSITACGSPTTEPPIASPSGTVSTSPSALNNEPFPSRPGRSPISPATADRCGSLTAAAIEETGASRARPPHAGTAGARAHQAAVVDVEPRRALNFFIDLSGISS